MITRIVVFPVLGRRWAFNVLPLVGATVRTEGESVSLKQLWQTVRVTKGFGDRLELFAHFVSYKMHEKWIALEKAPVGSIRNRVRSVGQRLLTRLSPSESFLKSVPKDTSILEIVFPSSINPRLVRRRVRHVAISGAIFHRRCMHGSFAFLPFTALLGVLPFPNIPLFWNLFRAHAHWRALEGSRKLLVLLADNQQSAESISAKSNSTDVQQEPNNSNLVDEINKNRDTPCTCKWEFNLDSTQILKWRDYK
eukprot:c26178_g1_i2 orf=141-893(+)